MSQVFNVQSQDEETGAKYVTIFVQGRAPRTVDDTNPNFDDIIDALAAGEDGDDILDLTDLSDTVAKRFENLSERVSVANGRLYLDGDEVDNALSKQVIRFLNEGVDDWQPLVEFFENVSANPQEFSREQLYAWLDRHDFTISEFGYIVGYKGVSADFKSLRSGPGIVNGESVNGALDNSIGNIVEIPRSMVAFDPAQGCAAGLHVGTYDFARGYSRGNVVKVLVNPRDVVSVPTDCDAQKVRVCRYIVDSVADGPITSAYADNYYDEDEPDDWGTDEFEGCEFCGGDEDYCDC